MFGDVWSTFFRRKKHFAQSKAIIVVHMTKGKSFSLSSFVSAMFGIASCRCENSKKVTALFQDFYPGKRAFASSIQNDSTETFE